MPTYEYECKKCGHRFEKFQSMKDEALKECPECGGEVRRLIGAGAGFLFKGSGFYITDYRSSSYKEKAKQEGGGKSSSDKSGGDKSGGDKSGGDKSGGDKSSGDKSGGDKSGGDKSGGDKSSGESSAAAKPKKETTSGGGA